MEDIHNLLTSISHSHLSELLYIITFSLLFLISTSVAAFTYATQLHIDTLLPEKYRRDRVLISLFSNRDRLSASLAIIKTFVMPMALVIISFEIAKCNNVGEWVWLIILPLVLATYLAFDLLPSWIARKSPIGSLHMGAYTIALLNYILKPIANDMATRNGAYTRSAEMRATMEELPDSIHMDSNIVTEDNAILTGLSRFVNTEVSDIMSPRMDVVSISIESTLQDIKEIVLKSGFSRYPVYIDEIDNIKGVLHVKDLIAQVDYSDFKWQGLIREPYFVTEEKMINDLLEQFQHKKTHLAIVVDEYGSMQGVITLEDIIEEVVGEISDESDKDKPIYKKLDNNIYLFDGKSHIADFLRIFNLEDDYFDEYRGEAESLAGMMLEVNRDFLPLGASIKLGDYTFIVESLNSRSISKIKIVDSGYISSEVQ